MNNEPRGATLVEHYKSNYNIADDAHVTEDMILEHWELEKKLRHILLKATPENRWEVFDNAYTELYQTLDWLNQFTSTADNHDAQFSLWHSVIGNAPQKIYEIGSGKGELITYLASQGFDCTATEVTRERGEKWSNNVPNLNWDNSDGIHLANFVDENTYDIALSNQVIEHMHPDDVATHFQHVNKILKPGGRYIFSTPHSADGPADVTRIFGYSEPKGMHLKEYTYGELATLSTNAKFQPSAVLRLPKPLRIRLKLKPTNSPLYLSYLTWIEKALLSITNHNLRVRIAKLSKAALFTGHMMMVATKVGEIS